MTNTQSTAESVSRTVWVLGQLRGYTSKTDMAKAMSWERTRLSRLLAGTRQWTLDDLVEVADLLGLVGPGELFRPLAELVGAIHPAASGGGSIGERPQMRYHHDGDTLVTARVNRVLPHPPHQQLVD